MADVAFSAVKMVLDLIREEARLQGSAGDDVRFIMDEMESMNNMLLQLVSTTKPNHHGPRDGEHEQSAPPARGGGGGGGDYRHLRTWMKQLLELAFDSRNSVELYTQSGGGGGHCCRLPWAMVARHQVVSRIRGLRERAREIGERQVRYAGYGYGGGSLLLAQRHDGNADAGVSNSNLMMQRRGNAEDAGRTSVFRYAILKREFVDNSSVDEALQRLKVIDEGSGKQQEQEDASDKQQESEDAGDKQKQQPKQSEDAGEKKQPSDAGDMKQQSDAGNKQQPTQSEDAGDKQLQSDGTDKSQIEEDKQEQQSTQLDGSDKQKEEEEEEEEEEEKIIRVVAIVVKDRMDEAAVGETVLKRYNILYDNGKLFGRWKYARPALHVSVRRPPVLPEIKVQIANQAKKKLRQMEQGRFRYKYHYRGNSQAVAAAGDDDEFKDVNQAEKFLKDYKEVIWVYQKQLLVLSGLSCPKILDKLKSFLSGLGRGDKGDEPLEFAIVLCTNDSDAGKVCSYPATDNSTPINYSLVGIYLERAVALLPSRYDDDGMSSIVRVILDNCSPDEVCMKMILHALYYNPDMTKKEMEHLRDSLLVGTGHQEKENHRKITFCYQALTNDFKNCLWYSAVFTRGSNTTGGIRRESLLRKWIAQELITEEEEANRCFDTMVEHNLINSDQVSGTGKVKSWAVHALVDDLITREAPTVEDLLLNNQLPVGNFDLLYSIRNGMQLHLATSSITSFMNSMSNNSMLLLKVLDLEGRNDLKHKDLCTICKICKLKYLSLRNTNVPSLPKQIGQLEKLETLDIRGTKVQVLQTVVPNLKHLLAGRIIIDCKDRDDVIKSKESFSTVCIPRAVETMKKLEILSRVKVTDGATELINVGDELKHIKKLGVVLSGKKASLKDLFVQIEKLSKCLRSLSIRMEPPGNWDTADVILLRPPKLLESLHICGIRRGLPPRIKELHLLAKITLRDTFLRQDDLCVLGMLPKLRYLRLFYHSFGEGTITFGYYRRNWISRDFENFENLTDIAIEDDIITSVTLKELPKLEKITWSFSYMESLSGVENATSLTHLVLNRGSCNPEGLQKLQTDCSRNGIDFSLNPPQRGEESRVVDPAP